MPEGDIEKINILLKQEKVKQLFGHCFEISKFKEGDPIPVGGESIFSPEANIKIEGDFESFKKFFQEIHEKANGYDLQKLREWLISQNINIDEKIFAKLVAFTKKFEQKYSVNPDRTKLRERIYKNKKELKLSDIFNANIAECAETAALAQAFLQEEDISSSYFSGDVLWNKDEEFSEEHSFIVIRENGKTCIYDPTNPTDTTSGKFPSIYSVEQNFDEEMAKNEKKFVTAVNILNKKEAFFGVNNRTNIDIEKDLI